MCFIKFEDKTHYSTGKAIVFPKPIFPHVLQRDFYMYTLVAAYGAPTQVSQPWQQLDVATVKALPMNQLFQLYRKVYFSLDAAFLNDPIHVDVKIFYAEYLNSTQTVEQMLAQLSNNTLETVASVPVFTRTTTRYEDAFRAGYKMDVSAPYSHPSSIVHPQDKTEIRMIRKNTDMQKFYDYCMVSVNGFYHMTDTDGQYVYLLGGGKTLLKSRQNHLGILSFQDIGKVKHIPITPSMVYKLDNADSLSLRAYFDLSALDTTNKTVFAVIGGYLYTPMSGQMRQYSEHTWMIDFATVPLLERYYEASNYLDFSSLGLTVKDKSPEAINTPEFFSDAHFLKYLTHAQSFIVIVDTPLMYEQKHFIRHNNYPGMFISYQEPKHSLITANGRVANYWKAYEDSQWAVNVHDAYWYHRQALSIDKKDIVTMDKANLPYRTYYHSKGYFLELGIDKTN